MSLEEKLIIMFTSLFNMRNPLDVIRESNERRKSSRIETPLDFIRLLNRERRRRKATERILKRIR